MIERLEKPKMSLKMKQPPFLEEKRKK